MIHAIRGGDVEIVKTLLAAGANANLASTMDRTTPLINAIDRKKPEMVKILLAAGTNPNIEGLDGTALSIARDQKHQAIVDELIKASAH